MKTLRTVFSLLLAVLLAANVAAAAFAAEDDILLSGTSGETVTWVLTRDGVLTVSGTGAVEDEVEVETEEDGNTCISTLDSISITFARYYDEQAEGLGAVDAARLRLDLVREIVVEEGITEIPQSEFSGMYPVKVTLPATLETLGYDAFDLLLTEEFLVNSVKLKALDLHVPAYENDAEPYEDPAAAREGYLAGIAAQEEFDYETIPLDLLFTYSYTVLLPEEAAWFEMNEEAQQEILAIYNRYLGTEETALDALVPQALAKFNEMYGKTYADVAEIFTVETDEEGNKSLVTNPDLQEMIDAKMDAAYDNSRLGTMSLGAEGEPYTAYSWFTVTAPAGGQIEADCKTSGVTFHALEGVTVPEEENENACPYCGKDHSGSMLQKVLGFFHKILYFFVHLLGIR